MGKLIDIELKQKVLKRIAEEKHIIEQDNLYNHFSEKEIYKAVQSQQDGDAWLFSQLYKNKLCFDHTDKQWMIFKEHYWQKDPTNEAITKLDDVIDLYAYTANQAGENAALAVKEQDEKKQKKYENKRKNCFKKIAKLQIIKWKNEVLALSSSGTRALAIEGNEWDKDPMALGCVNGVINLKTGRFRDGKPEDYIKAVCPTPFEGIDKECPQWIKFLEDIFNGKKELISFFQRLLGYSITGLSKEHIFPICWGNGRNGKGTLFELVGSILGDSLAEPIEAEMLLAQQKAKLSSGPSPDIMALRGKRIVWASETDRGRKLNVSKLKWLVGGDKLVGRNLHCNQCTFKPSHTLFLFTNHRPRADPDDEALWERIFLIPFEISFVDNPKADHERKKDLYVVEFLWQEASGILAWLVRGCMKWNEGGLDPPAYVKEATQHYKESEDDFGQFIAECCIVREHTRARASALREKYEKWCTETGTYPCGPRRFAERLKKHFRKTRDRIGVLYEGIGLVDIDNKNIT